VTLTVIIASIAVFSWKMFGYLIPQKWITDGIREFSERVTVVLLVALVAVQTFVTGNQVEFDARVPALGVAAILFALKVPYILVVVAAAATAAGLRLLGL
jgi:Branched-chain amino acid transport protein (AzlD)